MDSVVLLETTLVEVSVTVIVALVGIGVVGSAVLAVVAVKSTDLKRSTLPSSSTAPPSPVKVLEKAPSEADLTGIAAVMLPHFAVARLSKKRSDKARLARPEAPSRAFTAASIAA